MKINLWNQHLISIIHFSVLMVTPKRQAAQLWAKYKSHPRFTVALQDDDFASNYRVSVVSWKDKAEDALD